MSNTREHISYSELKDWATCPHYHKKSWIEKVAPFEGNEYTAFGSAIHDVCEKKLLKEDINETEIFQLGFQKRIQELMEKNIAVNDENIEQMKEAGPAILSEVEEALKEYFGDYEVFSSEEMLYVPIENFNIYFKGFVDAVIKVGEVYHLFDWKTCGWGWDSRKKADKLVTYQLTLYKHFFCQKHKIDPSQVETHFALLKRTAKKDRVELFKVTSGSRKTENALKLLYQAIYNISKRFHIKNRLACLKPYKCQLYKTPHCP
jgi:ATP-dependent exoDNAse (exonuclease V) beta subunit